MSLKSTLLHMLDMLAQTVLRLLSHDLAHDVAAFTPTPQSKSTAAPSRPCLVDNQVLHVDSSWVHLEESQVVDRTICALNAWCAQIESSAQDKALAARLVLEQHDGLQGLQLDGVGCCAFHLVLACLAVVDDKELCKVLSHQLGLVTRSLADWLMPSTAKTKKKSSVALDHLFHLSSCVRMLLHTRWQSLSGRNRRRWARLRLQCVHPDLTEALFTRGVLSTFGRRACAHFLSVQLKCRLGLLSRHGCLYVLSSPRSCYLGSTSCDRRPFRCGMIAPMARVYEHWHEIRLACRGASYAKHLQKTAKFKNLHLGDLCVWVVAVDDLPRIRALEQCVLRLGHWPANSQSTWSLKPRRSLASRTKGRRPPPRFRCSLSNLHQRSLDHCNQVNRPTVKLMRARASMSSSCVDSSFFQQAFYMNFHKSYWHVYSHVKATTGMFGPLDLRAGFCAALFARYLCEPKTLCWASIRQRWSLHSEPLGCEAIVGMFALQKQPSCYTRGRGIKCCSRWLCLHGLPGRKKRIQWPFDVPHTVFKSCLADVRRQLVGRCSPWLARWLLHTVVAVTCKKLTYVSHWNHIIFMPARPCMMRACLILMQPVWL